MKTFLSRTAAGSALLFLALAAGLYALSQPFQLALAPYLLWVCLFCAVLVSALYAMPDHWPRAWVIFALMALIGLLLWLWQDSLLLGAQAVFHKISYGYSQELPVFYYELPVPLTDLQITQYATRFLAFCALPLALWLGCWLLGGWWIWPGVAAVCLLPGLSLVILRQPDPICLAGLLLFLALVILSRRGYRQSAALGARRVLTAALPLVLVMGLLALPATLRPYRRAAWIEDLRQDLQRLNPSDIVLASNPFDRSDPGRQRFSRTGPPQFDGHTVLTVQAYTDETSLLLRGFSAGVYTYRGWEPLSQTAQDAMPQSEQNTGVFPSLAASGLSSDPEYASVVISHKDSTSDYYYTPYFYLDTPGDARTVTDDYLIRPKNTEEYAFQYLPKDSVAPGASLDDRYEEAYRQWVYENYREVPYDLLSQSAQTVIRDFSAQDTSYSYPDERGFRMAQADRVRKYLSSITSYDLSAPSPPAGVDFVSYFLTISHRGYCVHYATAATLILRTLGIPTRFVGGYVADIEEYGQIVDIPDRSAHAWVEIYIDGFGWQPVDVTPGFSGNPLSGELQASAAPSPSPSPSSPSSAAPTPAPSQAPSPTDATPTASSMPLGAVILLWCLGVGVILVSLIFLQRYLRLRRRRSLCGQADPNAAALELYRYLALAERRAGLPMPPQALELAQKAAFSQHILTQTERQVMETCARNTREALRAAPLPKRLVYALVWALC